MFNKIRFLCALEILIYALAACGVSFFVTRPTANSLDFPIAVLSGMKASLSLLPYRDFAVLYGPAGPLTLSLLRNFLGLSGVETFNVLNVIGIMSFFVLAFMCSRKAPAFTRVFNAIFIWGSVPFLGASFSYSGYSCLMLACGLVLLNELFKQAATRHARLLSFALGVLCAYTLFLRLNFGLYLYALVSLCLLIDFFRDHQFSSKNRRHLIIAMITPFMASIVFLAVTGCLKPYLVEMGFYLAHFSARVLPLTNFLGFIFHWVLPFLLGVLVLLSPLWARRWPQGTLASLSLFVCLVHYSAARLDLVHVYPILVLLPIALTTIPAKLSFKRFKSLWLYRAALVIVSIPVAVALTKKSWPILVDALTGAPQFAERNGVFIYPAEAAMLDELKTRLRPGDNVFWAPTAGSCESTTDICVNLNLYLAMKSLPVGYYWFFDPTITSFSGVQQRIIHDLEARRVRWIGLQRESFDGPFPPINREEKLLTNYVLRNFAPRLNYAIPEIGRSYVVYERVKNELEN